jgi:polyisoprenoid-binding protein YceI
VCLDGQAPSDIVAIDREVAVVGERRSHGEGQLPEPGRWVIDPVHSSVALSAWHLAISHARAMTAGPSGVVTIAPDLLSSTVEATISATTLTTMNPARDARLLGASLMEADRFRSIEFVSTGLWPAGERFYELGGRLRLHGVTREISLDLVLNGVVADTRGERRLGVTASTELVPDDFGLGGWGSAGPAASGLIVAGRVKVTLDIEAVRDENGGR